MKILYLDLDTTRPDHLGCYGYQRNTSPNIDHIAEQGIRFNNYYCSDAPCLPSRTALMSGRHGIHTGVVGHGGTAADMRLVGAERGFNTTSSLPGLLSSQGLQTVLISPFAQRHASWSYYAGFKEMHNTGKCGMESAEEVTPTALRWINNNAKEDNWYLHINYWDPHTPYRAPEEFGNPFADEPLPGWITEEIVQEHIKMPGPHTAREINMYNSNELPQFPRHPEEALNLTGYRQMLDGYDCGIRYMDEHIGLLLEALKKQEVLDELVIIISADHGENLGELAIYAEHGTADNITCRIPMIIRYPGCKAGTAYDGLHYNLDLFPTLAELFKQDPCPSLDGKSFAQTITNGKDCGWDYLVLSQCAHVCQRAVRFGPWIYIRTYHDGFHTNFTKEMLFNLESDFHEQNNLASGNPEICKQAVYYLNDWHDRMMQGMDCAVDPMWTVMQEKGPFHALPHYIKDHNYFERLRQTGRGQWIAETVKRHPELEEYI